MRKNMLFFHSVFLIQGINKGENFCYHPVNRGGDFLVQLQPGEDLHQVRVFLDRDIVLSGQFDDLPGYKPASLGGHPWRPGNLRVVFQRDCLLSLGWRIIFQNRSVTSLGPISVPLLHGRD